MNRPRRAALDIRWKRAIEDEDVVALGRLIAEDFEGTCKFLVWIPSRTNKLVRFEFGKVQRVLDFHCRKADLLGSPLLLWILKGRQFGCSTFFGVRNAIKSAIYQENSLLLLHLEAPGISMFSKIEAVLNRFPKELLEPTVRREKGTELRWESSVIKRESAERVDAGVSETYQHLHLSEVPLWKDADATMHGLLPTVRRTKGTSIVGEFTARAVGDYTHQMWVDSVAGRSGFEAVFLPWYWHEEYERDAQPEDAPLTREEREFREWVENVGYPYPLDENDSWVELPRGVKLTMGQMMWRRDVIGGYRGDIDRFRREYPSTPEEAFQTGGRRVFAPSVMEDVARSVTKPYRKVEFEVFNMGGRKEARPVDRDDGELWIWQAPIAGARYVIGADSSSGQGKDKSAATVLKLVGDHTKETMPVVATFDGLRRPYDFARLLRRLGVAYNKAFLIPERNFHGDNVIEVLLNQLHYRNIYRHQSRTRATFDRSQQHGFPTSRATKMPMVQKLVQAAYEKRIVVPCERTIGELRNFVYLDDHDNTAGATSGSHDDLVISLGLAVWGASFFASTITMQDRIEDEGPVVSALTGY